MSLLEYQNKLIDFYHANHRMPGYNEMMKMFGFKSKNSVYKLINKLVEEGVIEKDSQGKITPVNLFSEIKMLGSVQAGFPTLAEEDLSETINLDEYLIGKNRNAYYVLTVSGDSMIEAGICAGDLVVVEKKDIVKINDIVVACVDGEWTLKYFKKDRHGKTYLEPANSKYKNIYPKNSLTIGGVVRSVIRKY